MIPIVSVSFTTTYFQVLTKEGKYGINKLAAIPDPEAPHGTLKVDLESKEPPTLCSPIFAGQMEGEEGGERKSTKLTHDDSAPRLEDCLLTARAVKEEEIPFAERFVAMTLGADGESVEVRQLLHRDQITLEGLMMLIHYSAAVAGAEIKAFLSERSSPANLVPYKSLPMLRNSFTKEVQ